MNTTELMNSTFVISLKNKKEKVIVSSLCVWSFIHSYVIIRNNSGFGSVESQGMKVLLIDGSPEVINPVEYFYPIYKWKYYFLHAEISYYDFTEYFFYVGGVWMIYFLCRYLKSNK